mgnify:CR=1 FL=1
MSIVYQSTEAFIYLLIGFIEIIIIYIENGIENINTNLGTFRIHSKSKGFEQMIDSKSRGQERKITVKEELLKKKYATAEDIAVIDKRVKDLVKECEKFAEESPYPEKSVMYDAVYEQEDYPFIQHKL